MDLVIATRTIEAIKQLSDEIKQLKLEVLSPDMANLRLSGLYVPNILVRFPDGLMGIIQCVSEEIGENEATLLAASLLYDKKLLQGKDTLLSPIIVVLLTHAERFDEIPETIVRSVTTAEKLMNSPGDLTVLAVNTGKLDWHEYRQQVVSRIEKMLSDDCLRWEALKEKYLS